MKIAALLDNIGPSQKVFYMIKEFNKLSLFPNNSCSVFTQRVKIPVIKPFFSCYNISFFTEYSGIAVATTIQEAYILLNTSNNTKKYLYLWDLEWMNSPLSYSMTCDIFRDKRLKIIARSDSHAKAIKNFSNVDPIGTLDDWNLKQLQDLVGDKNE